MGEISQQQELALEGNRVETVSGFNRRVKQLLETGIGVCWIRGEISNLRRQSSGHSYFSLKDESSQVSAVMFRGDAARCRGIELRDGMQVVVFGEVSVYEVRGTYQVIVRMVTEDGLGRLQQEFERLKRKLDAEGLFDPARKKMLPLVPVSIGFITSPTGAAVQDFIRILKRRGWRGRLAVLPVRVQGTEAAPEMIAMLRRAEKLGVFDLLVIGRGGGSIEDLWAFNEEALVRAVAKCRTPIISAVGHETDFTLTDFAADVRAETPSAAAELISSAFVRCDERFALASKSLDAIAQRLLSDRRAALEALAGHLRLLSPKNFVERSYLRLDDLTNRLESGIRRELRERAHDLVRLKGGLERFSPSVRIRHCRERFGGMGDRLERSLAGVVRRKGERLQSLRRRNESLSPDAALRRGFAIVRDADGGIVSRKKEIRRGQKLRNCFSDGQVFVKVIDDEENNEKNTQ